MELPNKEKDNFKVVFHELKSKRNDNRAHSVGFGVLKFPLELSGSSW